MKIKVNVTQKDIDTGLRDNCKDCPIAKAISRTKFGKEHSVDVRKGYISYFKIGVTGLNQHRNLPEKAYNFILRFDGHGTVKPFKFTMELD